MVSDDICTDASYRMHGTNDLPRVRMKYEVYVRTYVPDTAA